MLQLLVRIRKSRQVSCKFSPGKIGGIEPEEARSPDIPGGNDSIQLESTQRALDGGKRRAEDTAQLAGVAAVK